MWGNLVLDSYMHRNLTTSFQTSKSDIILHLMQWQYWWWFWFSLFFIFYYLVTIKVVFFRSLKFYPKLSTSMRPRGRWGDLIIAIIPIYWCSNILINSNALLKVIEWQDMSSFLTVRVRGKQWYWVYKLGGDSNLSLQNNIGIIGNNSFFSLKNVFGGFYGAINNSFWSSWSESFYFSKTNDSFAQTEPYFYNDSALLHENCFVSYDSSANNIFYDSCGVAIGDVSRLRLETFSVFECIYPSYYEIPALYNNNYLLGDSDLLGHDYNFNYSYSYASYAIIKDCLDYELNESAWFNNCDVEDLFILEYCCSSCIFNDHDFFYIESNSTYFNCWPIYCDSFTNLNKFSYIIDCDTKEGFCLYCNNGSTFSYSDDSAFNLKFDLFTSFYSLLDFASLDSLFYSLGTDLCYNADCTLEDCSSFYSGLDDCSFDCQHYPYDCFSDLDNSPFIFDINQTDDLDLYCEYWVDLGYLDFLNPDFGTVGTYLDDDCAISSLYMHNTDLGLDLDIDSFFDYKGNDFFCIDDLYGISECLYINLDFIAEFQSLFSLGDSHMYSFSLNYDGISFYYLSNLEYSFDGVVPIHSTYFTDYSIYEVSSNASFIDWCNTDNLFITSNDSYDYSGHLTRFDLLPYSYCYDFDGCFLGLNERIDLLESIDYSLNYCLVCAYDYFSSSDISNYLCFYDDLLLYDYKLCIGNSDNCDSNGIDFYLFEQDFNGGSPYFCFKCGDTAYWDIEYGDFYSVFSNTKDSLRIVGSTRDIFKELCSPLPNDFICGSCDCSCNKNAYFSCINCFLSNLESDFSYCDSIHTVVYPLGDYSLTCSIFDGIVDNEGTRELDCTYFCSDGGLYESTVFDYYSGNSLHHTIGNWFITAHATPFVVYNTNDFNNILRVSSTSDYFKYNSLLFDYTLTNHFYQSWSDSLYIPFGGDYKYTVGSCRPAIVDCGFISNYNLLRPCLCEVDLSTFSEIGLFRSNNYKNIVDILFLDKDSLHKKPRYFLTMRQKPLKSWYSYSQSSGFIGNTNIYSSGISKSLETSNYPYSDGYSLSNSNRLLNTTTILVLPVNKHISIISNSFDVVHSWFIPGLGIKIDCVPGRSTHHTLYIDSPGFYYGQCAEVCGRFHHHMPIKVCALVFEHFLLWWNHYFVYLNESDNWSDSLTISRQKYSGLL